jgi:hypothetical protein
MIRYPAKIVAEQIGFDLTQNEPAAEVDVSPATSQPSPVNLAAAAAKRPGNAPRPPRNWKPSVSTPRAEMGQLNYRGWIRFLLLHDAWLTAFEKEVCLTVIRQNAPSAKQRKILWWGLYRIYPAGCGKWGSPSTD